MPRSSKSRRPSKRRSSERSSARKLARHLEGVTTVPSTDYELLRRFMTDHGKILPSRLVGSNAKQQRQIKRAVRRARVMGLLP